MILGLRSSWRLESLDHALRDLPNDGISSHLSSRSDPVIRSLPLPRDTVDNSLKPLSTTGIILVAVLVPVAFIIGCSVVAFFIHRRKNRAFAHRQRKGQRKGQHKRTTYMKNLGIGLLNNAAPPGIILQRPSTERPRSLSGPARETTVDLASNKDGRYSSDTDYALELESQTGEDHNETNLLPEYPATPYDPHGSHSSSQSPPSNEIHYFRRSFRRSKNYSARPISDSSNSYGMFMFRFSNPPRPHDIDEHPEAGTAAPESTQ
ncbi:hypothetical protein MMC10_000607 [Thelotrema lepadinum]|nr:hypothetical protein [Thelotrema lepadinum]